MTDKNQFKKGLTLIELLVAITIFIIVLATITGVFVSGVRSQVQAVATQNVADNARYAIESIVKDIRTGTQYEIVSSKHFKFHDYTGAFAEYCLSDKDGNCADTGVFISRNFGSVKNVITSRNVITSDEVLVNYLSFVIAGGGTGDDNIQPRVTISFGMIANRQGATEKINVQNTVSERCLLEDGIQCI